MSCILVVQSAGDECMDQSALDMNPLTLEKMLKKVTESCPTCTCGNYMFFSSLRSASIMTPRFLTLSLYFKDRESGYRVHLCFLTHSHSLTWLWIWGRCSFFCTDNLTFSDHFVPLWFTVMHYNTEYQNSHATFPTVIVPFLRSWSIIPVTRDT